MNSLQKGDVAVVSCAKLLTQNGYNVFFSLSEYLPYDMVATKDNKNFIRIQVKYKTPRRGVVLLEFKTVNSNGRGSRTKPIDMSLIDWFMIYCPSNDSIYTIPTTDLTGKKSISLRIDPAANNQESRITFAERFRGLPG